MEGPGRYPRGSPRPETHPAVDGLPGRSLGGEEPENARNEAMDLDVLDRGAAKRRALLGLHSLSDSTAVHAPGVGSDGCPSGGNLRSCAMGPPGRGAAAG